MAAQFHEKEAEFTKAIQLLCEAEDAAKKEYPPVPVGLPEDSANRGHPMRAQSIQGEIKALECNPIRCERNESGEVVAMFFNEKNAPLSEDQQAKLTDLKARLKLAIVYENACEAVDRKIKTDTLERRVDQKGDASTAIAERLASMPSKNREELLAKISVCRVYEEANLPDLAASILEDAVRLLSS